MRNEQANLGGRLALLKSDELDEQQKALYDSIREHQIPWAQKIGFIASTQDGSVIGPFNVVLQSPAIGMAFAQLQSAEKANTSLNEQLREVVILTAGSVWSAHYELYAHGTAAKAAGLSTNTIEGLRDGTAVKEMSEEQKLAQTFVKTLLTERRVPQALYDHAHAAFGVKGIVDIVMLAGCYQIVSSLLNTFEVPVPASG